MDSTGRCYYCGGQTGGRNAHPACHRAAKVGARDARKKWKKERARLQKERAKFWNSLQKSKENATKYRAQANQLLGAIEGSADTKLKKLVRKAVERGGFD